MVFVFIPTINTELVTDKFVKFYAFWLPLLTTVLVLCTLLLPFELKAAKPAYIFKNITAAQGLGNQEVTQILQDSQGYIWLATKNGLYRYDGYVFKAFKYDRTDPNSLAGNNVNALFIDAQGTFWIGSNGGLSMFNPGRQSFTNFHHQADNDNSLSANIITAISQDLSGNIWLATWGGGINCYDQQNARFTRFRHQPSNQASLRDDQVYSLMVDRDGVLWVGTQNGGLNRFDASTQQFLSYQHDVNNPDSLSHDSVYRIYQDNEGVIWLGTRGGGLNRFDQQVNRFTHYRHRRHDDTSLASDHITAIFQDNFGQLWVGSENDGVHLFNPTTTAFYRYQHDLNDQHSLVDSNVSHIMQDSQGLIWIGSWRGGISVLDPITAELGLVRHDSTLFDSHDKNVNWTILKDQRGILWIGTDSGLHSYNRKTQQFTHFNHDVNDPTSLSNNKVTSLFEDQQGSIWVGTIKGGLNRFNRDSQDFVHYRFDANDQRSLSDDYVGVIVEDKQGRLWVGTRNGLSLFSHSTQTFSRFRHDANDPHSISQNHIMSLYHDDDGALWVGTLAGVNRLDLATLQFSRYLHQPNNSNSLSHNVVSSIFKSGPNVMWFGTHLGLNRLDLNSGQFRHFGQQQGLNSNRVSLILGAKKGQMWLAAGGLSLFDANDFSVTHYAGVFDYCWSAGHNIFQAQDGQLFTGNNAGYCAFYPQQLYYQRASPNVVLTDVRIMNKAVALIDDSEQNSNQWLTLSHRDKMVSFEFAALNYLASHKNRYHYQLVGFDQQWIHSGATNRRATYTNLDPGDYTFMVKASNDSAQWHSSTRRIAVRVLPPPWLTWWAYTLYGLLGLMSIGLFVNNLQRKVKCERDINAQLKQLDKLKDDFLVNTSHELRTPLNGMIGLAESLMDGIAGQLPQKANKNLAMVVISGRRLTHLVDDIVDFSKLKNKALTLNLQSVDLHSLVDIVLILSKPLLAGKPMHLVNLVAKDTPAVLADENRLQQIIHNLVDNAIKFSQQGRVAVSAHRAQNEVILSVSDSGIAKSQFSTILQSFNKIQGHTARDCCGTGLGLAISQQLVALHGGTLEIDSSLGHGSTFSFKLPRVQTSQSAQTSVAVDTSKALSRLVSLEHQIEPSATSIEHALMNRQLSIKASFKQNNHANSKEPPFRLLLVDDEPIHRQVLKNHLSLQNYQLVEAASGKQAIRQINENGPFDLVLLDIMMPQMSGFQVCRHIRQHFAVNDLPIIFLSVKNQVADLVDGFAIGGNDYLAKPVAKNELLTRVATHLKLLDSYRHLERRMVDRMSQLEVLGDIGKDLNASLNVEDIFNRLYRHISQIVDTHVFAIGLLNQQQNTVDFSLALEKGRKVTPHCESMNEQTALSVWCIKHNQEVVACQDEVAKYVDKLVEPATSEAMASFVYLPLSNHCQQVIGCMTLQSPKANAYSAEQLDILRTLASYTAIALENAGAFLKVEQMNQQLLDTQHQLIEAEKMVSLGTLTAGVAHEINNPTNFVHVSVQNLTVDLTALQQFIVDLTGDDTEPEVLTAFTRRFDSLFKHLDIICDGTQRIKLIVQDLRTFSQLDAAECKMVCLVDCLQSTINLVRTQNNNVTAFITDFADSVWLKCYPAKLNQVFMNLIVNACDAIRQKLPQQQNDTLGEVFIACKHSGDWIEISIKDNGCGMSEQTKKQLFEPFYTTKAVGQGTGLGLSISYGIVQQHRGTLSVESQLGVGAEFTLRLPV